MTDTTNTMQLSGTAHATFEITRWDPVAAIDPGIPADVASVMVGKAFSGDLAGTSLAHLVTCSAEGREGAGYVATEAFTGTLAGRTGTFVMQHAGIVGDGPGPRQFGAVVPGSATGDLAGLQGDCLFEHDAQGARVTITWRLPS
ncbi:MAG TPA: DUF3224 domain-containing protein [Thermomicrobiales bacterium]|jgi:hypothetical protein|nr:DUF3224 domain-containing protein [Thermomicrobiales bacterium]